MRHTQLGGCSNLWERQFRSDIRFNVCEGLLHPLVLHKDVSGFGQPRIGLRNDCYDQRRSEALEVQFSEFRSVVGLLHKQRAQIIHSLIDDETRRRHALELARGDASTLDYVAKKPGMHFEGRNFSISVGVGNFESHLRRNDRRKTSHSGFQFRIFLKAKESAAALFPGPIAEYEIRDAFSPSSKSTVLRQFPDEYAETVKSGKVACLDNSIWI